MLFIDLVCLLFWFFFFKQKTAYEMRISDWSSDVCSSDLQIERAAVGEDQPSPDHQRPRLAMRDARIIVADQPRALRDQTVAARDRIEHVLGHLRHHLAGQVGRQPGRSEEHTSELQSLMRISYAVFCLKKNKSKQ